MNTGRIPLPESVDNFIILSDLYQAIDVYILINAFLL